MVVFPQQLGRGRVGQLPPPSRGEHQTAAVPGPLRLSQQLHSTGRERHPVARKRVGGSPTHTRTGASSGTRGIPPNGGRGHGGHGRESAQLPPEPVRGLAGSLKDCGTRSRLRRMASPMGQPLGRSPLKPTVTWGFPGTKSPVPARACGFGFHSGYLVRCRFPIVRCRFRVAGSQLPVDGYRTLHIVSNPFLNNQVL